MKKSTRYKLTGLGLAVLVFGLLLALTGVQEAKLQATLADGTVVTIEKVEVTKEPSYDPRNPWHKVEGWLHDQSWVQKLCQILKVELFNPTKVFRPGESYDNEVFCVWVSLSDPKRGFFPETVDYIIRSGHAQGIVGTTLSSGELSLIDDDGCKYAEGHLRLDYQKLSSQTKIVYVLAYKSFNRASPEYQLAIKLVIPRGLPRGHLGCRM